MSNMSYCRFQNTLRDLDDCKDALEAMMYEGDAALSAEELSAAKKLVETCAEILMSVAEATSIDSDEILDAALDTETVKKALDLLNAGAQQKEQEFEVNEELERENDRRYAENQRCGEAKPEHGGPQ